MGFFGNYAVYGFIFIILAASAMFTAYGLIRFLMSKNPKYLRFTDYVSATALFFCTLYALYHIGSIVRSWDLEVTMGLKLGSETLALAVEENYSRLNREFFSSMFFFILLLISVFLKNNSVENNNRNSN